MLVTSAWVLLLIFTACAILSDILGYCLVPGGSPPVRVFYGGDLSCQRLFLLLASP
jgi:hypothetical protein